jgi:hypothetical protein
MKRAYRECMRARSASDGFRGIEIEMQPLPPRQDLRESARNRSGSFDGQLVMHQSWTHTGTTDFHYSGTRNELDVSHIQSHVPGVGTQMMQVVEERARALGATRMITATSRPGFFQRQGFDYTRQQQLINARREAAEPGRLARDENNRGQQAGGGYEMHKLLGR